MSQLSAEELYEKWNIKDFNAHKISALCCSFLNANYVTTFKMYHFDFLLVLFAFGNC